MVLGKISPMTINPIQLSLFSERISAAAREMGAVLQRASFSPNIKDRLDYSCAIFDAQGALCAQAAHIPVHLGSMAYATAELVSEFDWRDGDTLIVNDPFKGGTHLPDITLISPIFSEQQLMGFVANRAHHANVGSETPGSMPISSSLLEEGLLIEPIFLAREGRIDEEKKQMLLASMGDDSGADISAQWSANRRGIERMQEVLQDFGASQYASYLQALQDYGQTLAISVLAGLPKGEFEFEDVLDDDGQGNLDIVLKVKVKITEDRFIVNFTGTSDQVPGNLNCPISVTAASIYYVFRCLAPDYAPTCAGLFSPLQIKASEGSLVNAAYPAAVAAGNVETSMRITDLLLGALAKALPRRIPAASQGTMNNVAMGASARDRGKSWSYYETLAGGTGGHAQASGLHATHSHMTNTLNTPVESLESHFPLRITQYRLRSGSGGLGAYDGGSGLVREYEFLDDAHVTLLTERRRHAPWGLAGGSPGKQGINFLNDKQIDAKTHIRVGAGDRLCIETPGGGGWGSD